ncbi:hypothetical protein OQA88_9642 [Cercophora sp. LCS_1]
MALRPKGLTLRLTSSPFFITRRLTTTPRFNVKPTSSPKGKLKYVSKPPPPKPESSNSSTDKARPINELFNDPVLRTPLIGGGIAAFLLVTYISLVVTSTLKKERASASPCCQPVPTGRPADVDAAGSNHEQVRQKAADFDRELKRSEWFSGISTLRLKLAGRVKGDVLEVAVGTGRNFGWYDWRSLVGEDGNGMRRFTGVDISTGMMEVARDRLRESVPGLDKLMRRKREEPLPEEGVAVEVLDGRVRLVVGDAMKELPVPIGGGKYDTVIQSFGLCSVGDPAKLLGNVVDAVKRDTGRIYLLEHGRGWFGFVNGLLDRYATGHFEKYGCWWNRDIGEILDDAVKANPGLEVLSISRPWSGLGTNVLIELRVNSEGAAKSKR